MSKNTKRGSKPSAQSTSQPSTQSAPQASKAGAEPCDLAWINRESKSPLRVWHVVLIFVLLGVSVPLALHYQQFGSLSTVFVALIAFTWINLMITLWEIALHIRIKLIQRQHQQFVPQYRGRELQRVLDFFTARLRLRDVFSPSTWGEVWSSYSVFDAAYANEKSFGFWADTGNGFVTWLPSLFFMYGLTYQTLDPRILGIVGLVMFWQMFYGTVIYFWAYLYSRQYHGHKLSNLLAFILGTNGLWMVFPAWAMAVSVQLILSNSYAPLL